MSKKNNNEKNFLVSTADFAFYIDDILACTGTTNLNASLEVSMEEQEVKAGKGNKLLYAFKYGRALAATLEAADWKLEYIAMASGSKITEGMRDVYIRRMCNFNRWNWRSLHYSNRKCCCGNAKWNNYHSRTYWNYN